MQSYTRLTQEERYQIYVLRQAGHNQQGVEAQPGVKGLSSPAGPCKGHCPAGRESPAPLQQPFMARRGATDPTGLEPRADLRSS